MITNLLKRSWTRVWKFINNGYIRTLVVMSIFSTTALLALLSQISNVINQQDWQDIFLILQFTLPVIVAPWLCKMVLKKWRAWCLVRLPGDPKHHAFVPFLRLMGCWHRRSLLNNFRQILSPFSMDRKLLFSLTPAELSCSRYPQENPLFVLKLPARTHLAIGDFVVLRLMRHILAFGGKMMVIIIDATRDTEEARQSMREKVICTRHFLQRMLGTSPKIVTMSEIHTAHAQSATNFLLTHFVVFFVKCFPEIQRKGGTSTDFVSFFTKGLILHALSQIVKSDPIIMVQWEKRLDTWKDIYSILPMPEKKLRITDFLQIVNFPNELGALLGTKKPEFAIVPEGNWLSNLLDSSSDTNNDYVIEFGQALLGEDWMKNKSNQNNIKSVLHKELKKVQESLVLGLKI